jgi:hypothetical protein
MSAKLQTLIEAAEELSPSEQLELINVVSRFLSYHYAIADDFWHPQTLEQLIETQQIRPVEDITALGIDFWPAEESTDDFIEFVDQQRREDT